MFERILNQERTPVWTVISLLTTVLVEAAIILIVLTAQTDAWGRLGACILIGLAGAVGFLVNCIAGSKAAKRGEYLGGRIATVGIAIWVVTVLGIFVIA
jgi:hypothetical protein